MGSGGWVFQIRVRGAGTWHAGETQAQKIRSLRKRDAGCAHPPPFFVCVATGTGCCAVMSSSCQAATCGCKHMLPCGLERHARETRSLPDAWLLKRCSLLRLSSSAHWFFSPATCVTASCTLRRADQDATCFKNCARGSVVVKSLLIPASAEVLSEAEGSTNLKCFD